MNRIALLFGLLLLTVPAFAKVVTKDIPYSYQGVRMKGYLAYDDAIKGKRPGVLVVHEWWGHNDYARKRARMLAKLGYVGFALDMYGDGKLAEHPKDAGRFAKEVANDMPVARARFAKAIQMLKNHPNTDANNIAAIGYCFGGAVVLDMARTGFDLKGVASFHGSLGTAQPAVNGKVRASVLVMNGEDDPFIKAETIRAFKKEMQNAGVDFEFINYKGAKHSFTNPAADMFGKKFKMPLQYNARADRASWLKLQEFLNRIFK